MKPQSPLVRIPEPCHEVWNKMTPDGAGRFCGSCSKTVVDFTGMTDAEIHQVMLEKKGTRVCGHFYKSQVNRPLIIRIDMRQLPRHLDGTSRFVVALLIAFGTFLFSCTDHHDKRVERIEISTSGDPLTTIGMPESPANMATENNGLEFSTIEGEVSGYDPQWVDDTVKAQVREKILGKPVISCEGENEIYLKGDVILSEPLQEKQQRDSVNNSTEADSSAVINDPVSGLVEFIAPQDDEGPALSDSVTNRLKFDQPQVRVAYDQLNVVLYPNPAGNDFTISYELLKQSDLHIQLFNEDGMLMRTIVNLRAQHRGAYHIPVQTNDLAAGLYILSVEFEGRLSSKKIIVQ
jgi:hypothetical protein